MKAIALVLTTFIFNSVHALTFQSCDEALRWVGGLDDEQRAAVEEVVQRDYSMRIYRKTVGDVERTLFLVGEVHVKAPGPARAGTRLVSSFGHSAVEGVQYDLYWFGKAVRKFVERELDGTRGDAKDETYKSEGSTTDESVWLSVARSIEEGLFMALEFEGAGDVDEDRLRKHVDLMLARLEDASFLDAIRGHALFPDQGDSILKGDFANVIRQGAKRVNYGRVIDELTKRRRTETSDASSPPFDAESSLYPQYSLERTYRPSLWRKMNAAWMLAADKLSDLTHTTLIFPSAALFGTSVAVMMATDGQQGIAATLVTGSFLAFQGLVKFGLDHSFNIFADVDTRNRVMMKEIDAIFHAEPERTQLLAIVGDFHPMGMDALAMADDFKLLLHFPMLMEIDGVLRRVVYK